MKKLLFLLLVIPMAIQAQYILPDGLYKFKLVGSGKYLQTSDFANKRQIYRATIWDNTNQLNQQWIINRIGNTEYYIISAANLDGKILTNEDETTNQAEKKNGGLIFLQSNNNKLNQRWKFRDLGNNQIAIILESTGQFLDASYATVNENGGVMQIWDEVLNVNQKWVAENQPAIPLPAPTTLNGQYIIPDGLYKFKLVGSGKYLQINNEENDKRVWTTKLWDKNELEEQQWLVNRIGNTEYYAISTALLQGNTLECNELLTKPDAKKNGEFIRVQQYNNKPNQRWKFRDLGNNQVAIVVESTGQYLDASYATMNNNGGVMQIWDEVLNVNQKWVVEKQVLRNQNKPNPIKTPQIKVPKPAFEKTKG